MKTSHVLLGLAAAAATVGVIVMLRRRASAAVPAHLPQSVGSGLPAAGGPGAQAAYSGYVAQNVATGAGGSEAFRQIVTGGAAVACAAKTGQPALCGAGAAVAAEVAMPVLDKALGWTKSGAGAIKSGAGKVWDAVSFWD